MPHIKSSINLERASKKLVKDILPDPFLTWMKERGISFKNGYWKDYTGKKLCESYDELLIIFREEEREQYL